MTMVTGRAFWAKVIGAPRANKFNPTVPQWGFDLSIDGKTAEDLIQKGMKKTYLRNKEDERGTFITFTRDAIKKDGSEGKPYKIVDAKKNPWPETQLIGNGSVLNVVVTLNERTFRSEKFLKPSAVAIQVWELVEYSADGFPTKTKDNDQTEAENW